MRGKRKIPLDVMYVLSTHGNYWVCRLCHERFGSKREVKEHKKKEHAY